MNGEGGAEDDSITLLVMNRPSTFCLSDVSRRQVSFCGPEDILERCIINTNYRPINPILTTPPPSPDDLPSELLLITHTARKLSIVEAMRFEDIGIEFYPLQPPPPRGMIVIDARLLPTACSLDRKD